MFLFPVLGLLWYAHRCWKQSGPRWQKTTGWFVILASVWLLIALAPVLVVFF